MKTNEPIASCYLRPWMAAVIVICISPFAFGQLSTFDGRGILRDEPALSAEEPLDGGWSGLARESVAENPSAKPGETRESAPEFNPVPAVELVAGQLALLSYRKVSSGESGRVFIGASVPAARVGHSRPDSLIPLLPWFTEGQAAFTISPKIGVRRPFRISALVGETLPSSREVADLAAVFPPTFSSLCGECGAGFEIVGR